MWKPRTRLIHSKALGKRLGMVKVSKERNTIESSHIVANTQHVEACLKVEIDVMAWARTTVNSFYVQEIAEALRGVNVKVMIKNPLHQS